MASYVLQVPDAYASQLLSLIAANRQTLPVEVVDVSSLAVPWDTVLAAGAISGGTNPTISAGDSLLFGALGEIDVAGSTLRLHMSGAPRLELASTYLQSDVPSIRWRSNVTSPTLTQDGTSGETLAVEAQSGGFGTGGTLSLRGGAGTAGRGQVDINVETSDGAVRLGMGVGDVQIGRSRTVKITTDTGYSIDLEREPGAPWIQVGPGVGTTGILFHAASPSSAPSVTGSRAGNAALTSLLTVLDDLQLIQDNTSA